MLLGRAVRSEQRDWGAGSRTPATVCWGDCPHLCHWQRAQAVLQGSKQARKDTRTLTTRVSETQQELFQQQRMAEELRGSLEEAEQVSQVPLCGCILSRGFVCSTEHQEQHRTGNALGLFLV